VHRLDKDTSGLLVVARTPEAHTALVAAMASREITREYLAVCTGVMTGGGTIDEPIGRHRTQRTRMTVRADGRPSVTHYRVVRRFRAHTLVRVTLETGRTHQIRVHLAAIDLPVAGDPTYGIAGDLGLERQFLHAARLAFAHPVTGEPIDVSSPLPPDLAAALETARAS